MQFIDKTKIKLVSGRGGNGMVAWRREKYVDKGGPAGGDGGNGGDVYFVADRGLATLLDFKYRSVFKAENGQNGGIKTMHGKCAKHLYIKVPLGTIVKDDATGKVIADLTEEGQTVLIAKGGRGGRGNARFASAQKRAPQFCEPGEPGIERLVDLELKLIADVGLLGMPNAGKSTFISVISSAKPKIADYPFTTLVPNLGVVKKPNGDGYVVADIPGLIEGASQGQGLGHYFLKHVERVRLILHLVDISQSDGRDFIEDYKVINQELENYSAELGKTPQIAVLSKVDLIDEETLKEREERFKKEVNVSYIKISGATMQGIEELKLLTLEKLSKLPKKSAIEIEENDFDTRDVSSINIYRIDNGTFVVEGGRIDNFTRGVVLSDNVSFAYFQNRLKEMGIIDMLKEKGLKNGDSVQIKDIVFEYTE